MGEHIKVALPLSLTLSGQLLEAVGRQWPHATIVTDTGEDRHMVIDPHGDADGRPVSTAVPTPAGEGCDRPASVPSLEDVEVFLTSLRDGTFGMSTPEWYAQMTLGSCRDILDSHDAPNYVEQTLYSADTNETYVVTVGRPGGKTPHQLRAEAEARAEAAEAALDEIVAAHGVTRTEAGWETPAGQLSDAACDAINAAIGTEP